MSYTVELDYTYPQWWINCILTTCCIQNGDSDCPGVDDGLERIRLELAQSNIHWHPGDGSTGEALVCPDEQTLTMFILKWS